jgi:serralysin
LVEAGFQGGLFSGLLEEDASPTVVPSWACHCVACGQADLPGQGGSTPGSYATSPTDAAYLFVSQTQAPAPGSGGNVAALMAGSQWSAIDAASSKTVITYSFADPQASTYAYTTSREFVPTLSAFSAADQQLTRDILHRIEAVCNVQFVEVPDNATECGVLRYGYSQQPNAMNFAGYAFFPSTVAMGGDIWIGADQADAQWDFYRPNLILHETLHAMGLKHPFSSGTILESSQNLIPNTVMSYSPVAGTTSGSMSQYPAAPMALDVAALQYLYGDNASANAGNTVYDLAGADFQGDFQCVWDAGGSDVFDASRIGHAVALDLGEGARSDVGLSVSATGYTSTSTVRATYSATVSVASGAVIENAVGSGHDDTLAGNAAANWLLGGLGNDRLEGRGGNDLLDGGNGLDTAAYGSARAGYSVTPTTAGHAVSGGATGDDSLVSVERLSFTDRQVALDLDGHAGTVAKVIGAVFGADSVQNAQYVGIGLGLLDSGMSGDALAQLALDARLGLQAGSQAVVDLLWGNVIGGAAPQGERDAYIALLDQGVYSAASLVRMAADSAPNQVNIDLVGLAAHGLDYSI